MSSPVPDFTAGAVRKVRIGLTLILAALLGTVAVLGLGLAGLTFLEPTAGAPAGEPEVRALEAALLSTLILKILQLVAFAGHGFCLAAPPRHGARAWAIVTLAVAAGRLTLDILRPVVVALGTGWRTALLYSLGLPVMVPKPSAGSPWLDRLLDSAELLTLLALPVVFLLFLRALVLCVGAERLLPGIRRLLILDGVILLGLAVLVGPASAAARTRAPPSAALIRGVLIEILLMAGAAVWYVVLVIRVRRALK